MAKSLILVTGATGAVGPRVVAALIDAGYQIRTLSLDAPPAGIWPKSVESLIGDVTDQAAVRSAMMRRFNKSPRGGAGPADFGFSGSRAKRRIEKAPQIS